MGYYLQGFLTTFVQAVCCIIFFDTFSERRFCDRRIRALFDLITVAAFLVIVFIFDEDLPLRLFVLISVLSLILIFSRKLKVWKSVAIVLLFHGLLGAVDLLYYIGCLLAYDRAALSGADVSINYSLAIVLSDLTLFIAVILIRIYLGKKRPAYYLKGTEWLGFIVFPAFTIGMIILMMNDTEVRGNEHLENVYLFFAMGLVTISIVAFYLICGIVRRENRIREDDLFREKVNGQIRMYRAVYDNYEEQRKRAHEYKNQIMCMESLLRKKEYSELEKYITEIGGKLTATDSSINTNNTLIDAIINTKYREMEVRGILLVMKFNELGNLWIDDDDIVIILSNLFNNAIEACEKCEEKTVKMKLMKEADDIIISVRNTYNGELCEEDGELRTLKSDREEHGIGIRNIIEAVEKYDGSYSISHDDREFSFSITIPRP